MTVPNSPRRAAYTGDGTTTEFPVPFQFFDIVVYINGVEQPANGTVYFTTQTGIGLSGTVVFNEAPSSEDVIVIVGATRRVQEVDYVNNDDFPAETHELALDRLTMIAQELDARILQSVRAEEFHAPVPAFDFAGSPDTLLYVDETGSLGLASVPEVLGGVDVQEILDAADAADASKTFAESFANAAESAAIAAAISEANAASATDILAANPVFTGFPVFEGGFRVGADGEGDSLLEFYDDTNDTVRSLWWDDTAHDWRVEDASGSTRILWHGGNPASQGEAEAGEENSKGMTALRVAQAIAALAGEGAFPAGTAMLFRNTLAPSGWTKNVDLNDYGIRIVSGSVSVSGTTGYTTVFASRTPTGTVNGFTLDVARIPSHSHPLTASINNANLAAGSGENCGNVVSVSTTGGTGGGGSHDHDFTGTPMNFNVLTADFILAVKD